MGLFFTYSARVFFFLPKFFFNALQYVLASYSLQGRSAFVREGRFTVYPFWMRVTDLSITRNRNPRVEKTVVVVPVITALSAYLVVVSS